MGRVMQVSQDSPTPEALDAATKVLEAGGVIVSPTDSVYIHIRHLIPIPIKHLGPSSF